MQQSKTTTALAAPPSAHAPHLKRSLSLPMAVLYGLGVTIGAGIYVLIGAATARAGPHAPVAFMIAAGVMALTAASFSELAGRMPVSAGEAAYVRAGLSSERLSLLVGLLVIVAGVVSAAAIARGSVGYLRVFVDLPFSVLVVGLILAMGAIAAWGIVESVALAGLMTIIELAGLLAIVGAGIALDPGLVLRVPEAIPAMTNSTAWSGIFAASLLSFFAFVGFEGLVNIAEEVDEPQRTLPKAIFITLAVTTLLYILVSWVAISFVSRAELAASNAPLGLVFSRVTGASPLLISAIAVVSTINGIIVQMVMSSRVIYGLAQQGSIPSVLGLVSPITRTPLLATGLVVATVLTLALAVPIEPLAEATSRVTLVIFALVNAALVGLKLRRVTAPAGIFIAPVWVPAAGCLCCIALLGAELMR